MSFLNRKSVTSSQNNNNLSFFLTNFTHIYRHKSNEPHFLSVYRLIKTTWEKMFRVINYPVNRENVWFIVCLYI